MPETRIDRVAPACSPSISSLRRVRSLSRLPRFGWLYSGPHARTTASSERVALCRILLERRDGECDKRLAFGLRNAGVGPAIVRTFAVEYNGHPYSRLRDLLAACCQVRANGHLRGIVSSTVHDSVIMAHEDVPFIEVLPSKADPSEYASIGAARHRVRFKSAIVRYLETAGSTTHRSKMRNPRP